jgi:hypothetical protein
MFLTSPLIDQAIALKTPVTGSMSVNVMVRQSQQRISRAAGTVGKSP